MTTEHTPNDGHPECADAAVEFEIEFSADNPETAKLLGDDPAHTPTEWVVWCHLHRHYVLDVDGPAPTWTFVQADARRFTSTGARQVVNTGTWLDHEPTPWALSAPTAELAP